VNGWERLGEWLATLAVASVAWASGIVADFPPRTNVDDGPLADGRNLMVSWAQDVDEPPIEQVGEGTDDTEPLDEGGPPAEPSQTEEDIETLDAETLPAAPVDGEVEPLDQGPPTVSTLPPAPPAEAPAESPPPTTAAPATYVAPETSTRTGPVVPPGFGSGRVHVATGRGGFPPGLDSCHVGAVTGRAYVGIDCDNGDSFVGHAPSFEDFPFTEDFPFGEGNSPFADPNFPFIGTDFPFDGDATVVSTQQERASATKNGPRVIASGTPSVRYQQRAKRGHPVERVQERGSKSEKQAQTGRKQKARADDHGGKGKRTSAKQRATTDSDVKTEKSSKKANAKKDTKKPRDKQEKKRQSSRNG